MPLSEHEQQILAEIERQLADDDPGFVARNQRRANQGVAGRRRWQAIAIFVVGLVLTAGLAVHLLFGLAGFACMFVGLVLGATTLATPEPRQHVGPRDEEPAGD